MSSESRQVLVGANLLLLASLIAVSAFTYERLPADIPIHYGANGEPDAFTATTWLSWMLVPLLAMGMTAMMGGVGWLIRKIPDQLNVPEQKLYRSLSAPHKDLVIDDQLLLLHEITLGLNLMFVALQAGSYEVAMGFASSLPWYSGAAIAGFLVLTLVVAVRAVRRSGRLIRQLATEGT